MERDYDDDQMDFNSDESFDSSSELDPEYVKPIILDMIQRIDSLEDNDQKERRLEEIIKYDFTDLNDFIQFNDEETNFITTTLIKNLRYPVVQKFLEDLFSFFYPLRYSFHSRYAIYQNLQMKDWMTYVDILRKVLESSSYYFDKANLLSMFTIYFVNTNGHLDDAIEFTKNEILKLYLVLRKQPQFRNLSKHTVMGIAIYSIAAAECDKVKYKEEKPIVFNNDDVEKFIQLHEQILNGEEEQEYGEFPNDYSIDYNKSPTDLAPLFLCLIAKILGIDFNTFESRENLCAMLYKKIIKKIVGENTWHVTEKKYLSTLQDFLKHAKNMEEATTWYEEHLEYKKNQEKMYKELSPPLPPSPKSKRRKQ